MNYNILGYSIYLVIIVFVIIYVGHQLFKNGRLFCLNAFNRDVKFADAVNKMLLAGYYLINIGYSVVVLVVAENISDTGRLMEVLGYKVGVIVLGLGIIHYINVIVITGIGQTRKQVNRNINL